MKSYKIAALELMRIAYFIGVAILAVVIFWPRPLVVDQSDDFHPNGTVAPNFGAGAIVCPDSVDARSEFHKGIQQGKQANQIQPQHNEDGSGCSALESGVPIYIENEDTAGIATISVKLPNGTLLHGITYAQEIQRQQ